MSQQKTIHLVKPHRHAGRNYPAGAQITLAAHKADWLIGVGTAKAAAPAPAPASAKQAAKD